MEIMNKKNHLIEDMLNFAIQASDDVKQKMKHDRYPALFVYVKQLSDPQVMTIMAKYLGHALTEEQWTRIRATPRVELADCKGVGGCEECACVILCVSCVSCAFVRVRTQM